MGSNARQTFVCRRYRHEILLISLVSVVVSQFSAFAPTYTSFDKKFHKMIAKTLWTFPKISLP